MDRRHERVWRHDHFGLQRPRAALPDRRIHRQRQDLCHAGGYRSTGARYGEPIGADRRQVRRRPDDPAAPAPGDRAGGGGYPPWTQSFVMGGSGDAQTIREPSKAHPHHRGDRRNPGVYQGRCDH